MSNKYITVSFLVLNWTNPLIVKWEGGRVRGWEEHWQSNANSPTFFTFHIQFPPLQIIIIIIIIIIMKKKFLNRINPSVLESTVIIGVL